MLWATGNLAWHNCTGEENSMNRIIFYWVVFNKAKFRRYLMGTYFFLHIQSIYFICFSKAYLLVLAVGFSKFQLLGYKQVSPNINWLEDGMSLVSWRKIAESKFLACFRTWMTYVVCILYSRSLCMTKGIVPIVYIDIQVSSCHIRTEDRGDLK